MRMRVERRRSQRVAEIELKSLTTSTRKGRRAGLRSNGKREETVEAAAEEKIEFEIGEMETQVVTCEDADCEDVSTGAFKDGKSKSKSGDKLDKSVDRKTDDEGETAACKVPSSETETNSEEEANSDKENDKVTPVKKDVQEESEDEAKSAWLGMAFGLKKSPTNSPSPDSDKKSVSKVKKGEVKMDVDDELVETRSQVKNPDEASTPTSDDTSADAAPSKTEKVEDKLDPSTATDSGKQNETDTSQPVPVPLSVEPSTESEPGTTSASAPAVDKVSESQATSNLAKGYKSCLKYMEDYSLNYVCQEVHHPVISCFRELSRADVRTIVGNTKVKKSCDSLEQSVIYLGLIDLMATTNNNPFHGENNKAKFSKNVSGVVQRILLEFKNIIGSWALSGNEQLNNRYSLIIKYLRNLVPFFQKAKFDEEFSSILDSIEKEVERLKSNQDKLKSMGSSTAASSTSTNQTPFERAASSTSDPDTQDSEIKSALGEIVLNVKLDVKEDVSDDDDEEVTVVEEKEPKIFGKPLKASPGTFGARKKQVRKPKSTMSSPLTRKPFLWNDDDFKPKPKSTNKNTGEPKTPKSHTAASTNTSSLPQPKVLASMFQSSSSPQTTSNIMDKNGNKVDSVKRNADEELSKHKNESKKLKLDKVNSPVSSTEKQKQGIRSFFQPSNPSPKPGTSLSCSGTSDKPKTTVNAFALMMNRSRELAQKKKMNSQQNSPSVVVVDMVEA